MWGLEEEGGLGAQGGDLAAAALASLLPSRALSRTASQQLLVGQGPFSKPLQSPLETLEMNVAEKTET